MRGGGDFEPPRHGHFGLVFFSKFWRVYKSGVFALRAEGAIDTWSGGTGAGVKDTASMTPQQLPAATFVDVNIEMRIVGVTIFWVNRNARAFLGSYVPGLDYPRNYQFYGVTWRFTN